MLKPRKGDKENGAEVLGIHVEGPFITPNQRGAHEESCFRTAPNGFNDFVDAYGLHEQNDHAIKIITVAPDVEGVLDSLKELIKVGITVSIGTLFLFALLKFIVICK